MSYRLLSLLNKAARKPPHVVAHRLVSETRRLVDRYTLPAYGGFPTLDKLLSDCHAASLHSLWQQLAQRPYASARVSREQLRAACPPHEQEQILAAAERAVAHEVNLLGSGWISLGEQIRWCTDYQTNHTWSAQFAADIEYSNLDQPSDVKFPWELSRVQWLLPLGQAFQLTGDQRYATAARQILQQWVTANPYARTVNWSCTMEVAMRVISWTCLFHMCHDSEAWQEAEFQSQFLSALLGHCRYTEQYLEYSDVNGNHCTADLAGMVFAGLFFGGAEPAGPRLAKRWLHTGWRILQQELPKQVTPDGVDFEGSIPYHRLCAELFFLPAWYREQFGLTTPAEYRQRVLDMGRFTQAYCKPSGRAPLWGDADDARTLPLGQQGLNEHRYLPTLLGAAWHEPALVEGDQRNCGECLWLLGPIAEEAASTKGEVRRRTSRAFPHGGYYVLQNECDHVFVDLGPIGLAGRGGHGHNDCLSFEAVLCGVELITDSGAYVYTGNYQLRNQFRSTAAHNTPRLDAVEINRFHGPKMLWTMQYDALPEVHQWSPGAEADLLVGTHRGYQKLPTPVTPVRSFRLEHAKHRLTVTDRFEAAADARGALEIPLHLAPNVIATEFDAHTWQLQSCDQTFLLTFTGDTRWRCNAEPCQISPSYGVLVASTRLCWRYEGELAASKMSISIAKA